ncbi:MAG: EAL domain-containing protein [Pseudolabrys sp.]
MSPQKLQLEITETVLLQNTFTTLATLNELRKMGVQIALDDFGTAYSSLSYLRSFPFDKIKIDRSFIQDLSNGAEPLAIVNAVAGLAKCLNMTSTPKAWKRSSKRRCCNRSAAPRRRVTCSATPGRRRRSGSFCPTLGR